MHRPDADRLRVLATPARNVILAAMTWQKHPIIAACLLAVAISAADHCAAAETQKQLSIGTGSKTGVYYPTGRAICRMLNRLNENKPTGWDCQQRESAGSVANLEALRDGKIDLAVVQSDTHFHAFTGTGKFKDKGAITDLRSVFSLHAEPFTIIARAGGGVWKLEQLKGRRINVGKKGSGPRETFFELLETLGWNSSEFSGFTQYDTREQATALCDSQTDVITFVVGHPSQLIRDAIERCNTILVSISNNLIRKVVAARPYYRNAIIPAGLYRGANSDTRTFGVSATLVTTSRLDPAAVYAITQAVFTNIDKFRSMHPALKHLNRVDMAHESLPSPLHDGAKRYFQETGLIK